MADSDLEDWSPEEVKAALDRGEIVLIDVRTPQEFLLERIEGALLAPMADFTATSLPTQTDKRIVLHCGSGVRSKKVGDSCIAAGVAPMAHMAGGFAAWKARKLPYIGTDMATGAPKKVTP
ncbi:rhodanese-like domain-containing protein [Pikeienuella piscinae]|uniref:Rhodanese-like domain-containing protein n=1 Tax=Pikeienuella piscinae TaxID=2748098 RepID=A0A7L5BZT3_9RHOB|nr:rhodanese-like domain-containing protein [Pikeienuella piscinae]QIE55374.1 rhodanese-like domain-containing protein [Pikeienuella piscinae]